MKELVLNYISSKLQELFKCVHHLIFFTSLWSLVMSPVVYANENDSVVTTRQTTTGPTADFEVLDNMPSESALNNPNYPLVQQVQAAEEAVNDIGLEELNLSQNQETFMTEAFRISNEIIGSHEVEGSLTFNIDNEINTYKGKFWDANDIDKMYDDIEKFVPNLRAAYQEAFNLKDQFELAINDIPNNAGSAHAEILIGMYTLYSQKIIIPLRRLSLIMQEVGYYRDNIDFLQLNNRLMVDVPKSKVQSRLADFEVSLTGGDGAALNSGLSFPFDLNLARKNGQQVYEVTFNFDRRLMTDVALMMGIPNTISYIKGAKWYTNWMMANQIGMIKKLTGDEDTFHEMPNRCVEGFSGQALTERGRPKGPIQGFENGSFPEKFSYKNNGREFDPDYELYKMLSASGLVVTPPTSVGRRLLGFDPEPDLSASEERELERIADKAYIELSQREKDLLERATRAEELAQMIARGETYIDHLSHVPVLKHGQNIYGTWAYENVARYNYAVGNDDSLIKPRLTDQEHFSQVYQFQYPQMENDINEYKVDKSTDHNLFQNGLCDARPEMFTPGECFNHEEYACLVPELDERNARKFIDALTFYVPPQPGYDPSEFGLPPLNDNNLIEFRTPNGTVERDPDLIRHFTPFLVKLMQREGTMDIEDLANSHIDGSKLRSMKSNNFYMEFPSYFDPDNVKKIAIEVITEKLAEAIEGLEENVTNNRSRDNGSGIDNNIPYKAREAFSSWARSNSGYFSGLEWQQYDATGFPARQRDLAKKLIAMMDFFMPQSARLETEYFPAYLTVSDELERQWPYLKKLWKKLKDEDVLVDTSAQINEFEFLIDSFKQNNPAASLRLSYLMTNNSLIESHQCKFGRLANKLRLTSTFKPFFTDSIVSDKQKKIIWETLYDEVNGEHNFFLNQSTGRGSQTYYDIIRDISHKTVVKKVLYTGARTSKGDNVPGLLSQYISGQTLRNVQTKLNQLYNDPHTKKGQELYDIWKAPISCRGNGCKTKEEQALEFLDNYAMDNEEDLDGYDLYYSPKKHLIQTDFNAKYFIFTEILKQAGKTKLDKLKSNLDELCNSQYNEIEEYKKIYYSTVSTQNALNQKFGNDGAPPSVLKQISFMAKSEKYAMWMAMGILPVMLVGFITMTSCALAPPVCIGILAAAAVGGMAMIAGNTAFNLKQYNESEGYRRVVSSFHELGFTDKASVRSMRRTPFMLILDALMIIPLYEFYGLIALTARFAIRNMARAGSKTVSNIFVHAHRKANMVWGYRKIAFLNAIGGGRSPSLREFLRSAPNTTRARAALATQYANDITDNVSERTLATWIGGALRGRYYNRGGLNRMMTTIKSYVKTDRGSLVKYRAKRAYYARKWKKWSQKEGRARFAYKTTGWFFKRKARIYHTKAKLVELIELMQRNLSMSVKDFTVRYIDQMAVLQHLPFKKAWLFHFMFGQGGPMWMTRIPGYQNTIDSFMLKSVFQTYDNMLGEVLRKQILMQTMGIDIARLYGNNTDHIMHNSYEFMQKVIEDVKVFRAGPNESTGGEAAYRELQEALAEAMIPKIRSKASSINDPRLQDKDGLIDLLFNATDDNLDTYIDDVTGEIDFVRLRNDQILSESIWNMVDLSELIQTTSPNAHRVMGEFAQELMNKYQRNGADQSLDDFEKYMRAVRLWFESRRAQNVM